MHGFGSLGSPSHAYTLGKLEGAAEGMTEAEASKALEIFDQCASVDGKEVQKHWRDAVAALPSTEAFAQVNALELEVSVDLVLRARDREASHA